MNLRNTNPKPGDPVSASDSRAIIGELKRLGNIRTDGRIGVKNLPAGIFLYLEKPGITLFPVDLTVDGGDDGDATTTPSYTYTAKNGDGTITYGTGLSPETGRQIGSFNPATDGEGYIGADGNFALRSADEKENTVVCGSP